MQTPHNPVTTFTYDPSGNVIRITVDGKVLSLDEERQLRKDVADNLDGQGQQES